MMASRSADSFSKSATLLIVSSGVRIPSRCTHFTVVRTVENVNLLSESVVKTNAVDSSLSPLVAMMSLHLQRLALNELF